jgi:transposase-like protein
MEYTTRALLVSTFRVLPARLHLLAVLCFLVLTLLGCPPQASAGWVTCPPVVYAVPSAGRRCHHCTCSPGQHGPAAWRHVCRTWHVPLLRSLALAGLRLASGQVAPLWVIALPWAIWTSQCVGILCPALAHQPEWRLLQRAARFGERVLLWAYLGLVLGQGIVRLSHLQWEPLTWRSPLSDITLFCAGPSVTVRHNEEQGGYVAQIEGSFVLHVADDQRFRLRLLVLFLRLFEVADERRGSRRTRDGRTPFVRQQYLAEALGIPQPDISRWERYWQTADWRRLLSQAATEVLTLELQQKIIEVWAHWPGWGVERVQSFLAEQGIAVTVSQVQQAAHESGWQSVRGVLAHLCVQQGEKLRLREGWLLGDLLAQVQTLLDKVEAGERLSKEETVEVASIQAACEEAGLAARVKGKRHPWLQCVQQVLFQPWEEGSEAGVRCIYCGSTDVGRKSLKPRIKRFVDAQGVEHTCLVYRYYCHNPACSKGSFTALPPGLLPYSRHRLETHVLALQMYAWGYSTYRRTGKALGVPSMTAYRWVSAFGEELLSVTALFGMLKWSGVAGVDEKWVKVPKNNKPASPQRKWMYVYVAVDMHTWDLLHIAIYPYNTKESAHAFLLALRAKGYHPRAVVTDLRQDYGAVISQVFPQAQHHECLFHASQALHRQFAEIYGWQTVKKDEQIMALRQAFDKPLQARTKRTARRRYDKLMAQREECLRGRPELAPAFVFLETHWPKLVNGVESDLIPRTNNTTELVIRRFDQHYQNFCGFDSLETAQRFLGVFEKVYRFTPFSNDAQPRIRGKSPLQLAGYDVNSLPMAANVTGWAIAPPARACQEGVPNA